MAVSPADLARVTPLMTIGHPEFFSVYGLTSLLLLLARLLDPDDPGRAYVSGCFLVELAVKSFWNFF